MPRSGVIRAKGYSATRIEDICEAAGLTKGSFFHHFKSKEELALTAADHFAAMADRIFAAAPYQAVADPLDRVSATSTPPPSSQGDLRLHVPARDNSVGSTAPARDPLRL